MKQALIIVIILLSVFTKGYACECNQMNLKNEIDSADLIFQGIPIEKNQIDSKMIYRFYVYKVWKGNHADTIEIKTGLGGQDCGMIFEIGKTYIVFSKNGMTSYCRKNALVDSTIIDLKLDYLFTHGFSSTFKNSNKKLTEKESEYLNMHFKNLNFDFTNKSIIFTSNSKVVTKSDWIKKNIWYDSPSVQLIKLTETEKEETGYDAILVTWSKRLITEKMKQKILKQKI
ncbi:MAG: hypothetical protein DRJ01_16565 [Bacteroidetes bacterium]|nr:MAG: hypothetical protein DRJ01_16565 [Bacteroidota bacterium]